MAVVGCCVDESLFSSSLLITSVYPMMILMSYHTHNRHIRVKIGLGGGG